ncbi:MAG: three-Cys-motif partner protein TcmP [Chloroflexi bacterium]|nr:MAG: three-Cys-motif partner protein TcmP [Chloroflexota bacterium]
MSQDKDNFFREQKNWSKRKLAIIRGYLASFSKILGSTTKQSCVYFIDGFAGAGRYQDGSPGSPYLAAELAQQYCNEQRPYHLNCINIEENEENYRNLVLVTAPFNGLIDNYFGSFSSNLQLILNKIGKCPALFFIDPFGVKGTEWKCMHKIIHRQAPTDIWIRFDHKTIRRLSGFFDSGTRGAESKIQNLLELYGISRPDNLYQMLQGDLPEERIFKALSLYVGKLEEEFRNARGTGYSFGFPIVSLNGEIKYHLVFASAHQKAALLASETIYSVERNRNHETEEYKQRKSGQLILFSTEPTEEEISLFISEKLSLDMKRLCAGEQLGRQEIYMRIIRDNNKKWFGNFSSSHFTKALSLLQAGIDPVITARDGANSKEKTIFTFRAS